MGKQEIRLILDKDGTLSIEDPSPFEAALFKRLGIKMHENSLDKITGVLTPAHSRLKGMKLPCPLPQKKYELLALHNKHIEQSLSNISGKDNKWVSIYDLKRKIMKMYLRKCCLCGHQCRGKRIIDGECNMGKDSYYHQHFIHVGEEAEIGRTLVFELTGCNIRCKFCQKGALINPEKVICTPFTDNLWGAVDTEYDLSDFNNVSFLGGNPDQSIMTVLDFLENAPDWALQLPVVWHTNGYSSIELYNMLWGLVDIWVFDFKYFSDSCATSLSNAPHYVDTAKKGLTYLFEINRSRPVIVRHLLLPGHWKCCQKPLLEWLKNYKREVIFHPMAQYRPLWKISGRDKRLSRNIKAYELKRVLCFAEDTGLILTGGSN